MDVEQYSALIDQFEIDYPADESYKNVEFVFRDDKGTISIDGQVNVENADASLLTDYWGIGLSEDGVGVALPDNMLSALYTQSVGPQMMKVMDLELSIFDRTTEEFGAP